MGIWWSEETKKGPGVSARPFVRTLLLSDYGCNPPFALFQLNVAVTFGWFDEPVKNVAVAELTSTARVTPVDS